MNQRYLDQLNFSEREEHDSAVRFLRSMKPQRDNARKTIKRLRDRARKRLQKEDQQ